MTTPTIASRLERRFIAMSGDRELTGRLRAELPAGWGMVEAAALRELGGFDVVLQHRFILLDLDERAAFQPLDIVHEARRELMLNIAIFCFGGDAALRDEARLARADRFFERAEITGMMKRFCEEYGW